MNQGAPGKKSTVRKRANGEGGVFLISKGPKAGKWVARLQVGLNDRGKPKVVERVASTRLQAADKLRELKASLEKGVTPDSKLTVREWLLYWLNDIADIKPKTREGHMTRVTQYIIPTIGEVKLQSLKPEHLDKVYKLIRQKGLSQSTVHQTHAVLRRALNVALYRGKVVRNVAIGFEGVGPGKKHYDNWDTVEAMKVLRTAQSHDLETLVSTLAALLLALRQGEKLALQWSDIHENDAEPWINVDKTLAREEQRYDEAGKKIRRRLVLTEKGRNKPAKVLPLIDPLPMLFRQLRQQREAISDWVFWGRSESGPCQPKYDWTRWQELADQAGVKRIPIHGSRSTTASVLVDLGVNPIIIAQILGNIDVATTVKHYARADNTMAARELGRLVDVWGAALDLS